MTGQQKFTLFLTFLTGAFAGGYLYVTTFAPQYAKDDVPEQSQITVVGEIYGGCARGGSCPSFRFTEDGDYQYMQNEDGRESGKLPAGVIENILSQLSSYRLQSYAAPAAIRNCRSYVDGIDYKYEISFENKRYVLDTCATLFPHDSGLQLAFLEALNFMQNPTTTYPVIIEKGFSGWILDRFQGGSE